jgi:hypothetical protein
VSVGVCPCSVQELRKSRYELDEELDKAYKALLGAGAQGLTPQQRAELQAKVTDGTWGSKGMPHQS